MERRFEELFDFARSSCSVLLHKKPGTKIMKYFTPCLRASVLKGLELSRNRLSPACIFYFEELSRLEAEHSGKNVGGEDGDLGVQVSHHGVIVAARVLDVAFQAAQLILQLAQLLRRLQLR